MLHTNSKILPLKNICILIQYLYILLLFADDRENRRGFRNCLVWSLSPWWPAHHTTASAVHGQSPRLDRSKSLGCNLQPIPILIQQQSIQSCDSIDKLLLMNISFYLWIFHFFNVYFIFSHYFGKEVYCISFITKLITSFYYHSDHACW